LLTGFRPFGSQKQDIRRDIKPQNIRLMGGSVKVADFGLARPAQHTTTARDLGDTLYIHGARAV
jgi:serine/threonine protein kinase